MNTVINFADMMASASESVTIPEGTLCAWVDCCNCLFGEYNPPQGAYWCKRYKEHPTQQGCSFGIES